MLKSVKIDLEVRCSRFTSIFALHFSIYFKMPPLNTIFLHRHVLFSRYFYKLIIYRPLSLSDYSKSQLKTNKQNKIETVVAAKHYLNTVMISWFFFDNSHSAMTGNLIVFLSRKCEKKKFK